MPEYHGAASAPRPIIFGEVLYDVFPDGQEILGGAPFNVAWHLQGFGLRPLLISAVGGDARGEAILEGMRDWGMDTSGVQVVPDAPTGTVEITQGPDGHGFAIPDGQAYDRIDTAAALAAIDEIPVSLLYHGSLALRGPASREALVRIRDSVTAPVFLDVNLRAPWWDRDTLRIFIDAADWLKLNDAELLELGGAQTDGKGNGPDTVFGRGLAALIVTRGEQGALIVPGKGDPLESTPPACPVIDTVGAGDAFSSVCILGIDAGWELAALLERAGGFASDICGIRGATTTDVSLYAGRMDRWHAKGSVGNDEIMG